MSPTSEAVLLFLLGLIIVYKVMTHYFPIRFVFTTTRIFDTYTDRLEVVRNSVSKGQVTTSSFCRSSDVAVRCWDDPRVSHLNMDPILAVVFAEVIEEYIDALQWCSGSEDFAKDGHARVGWEKIVEPLLRSSQ